MERVAGSVGPLADQPLHSEREIIRGVLGEPFPERSER